jgi:hypothetical protein
MQKKIGGFSLYHLYLLPLNTKSAQKQIQVKITHGDGKICLGVINKVDGIFPAGG